MNKRRRYKAKRRREGDRRKHSRPVIRLSPDDQRRFDLGAFTDPTFIAAAKWMMDQFRGQ